MFDLGFWELVVVATVALLVVGPERLPGLVRQVGLWLGRTRRFINSVRADIERELQTEELKQVLNQQQEQIRELKGLLSDTQHQVRRELAHTDHLVKAIEEQIQAQPAQATPNLPGTSPVTSADEKDHPSART